jgi:predicted phage tail protein
MKSLTKITLHGVLGDKVGKTFDMAIGSVSEALHAIEICSGRKLYKNLLKNEKKNIKYRVLVNNEDIINQEKHELSVDEPESIKNSELTLKRKNIKSIDIIPVVEGSDSGFWETLLIIIGVILMIGGLFFGWGVGMAVMGAGLIFQGISSMLTEPPEFEDFREIQQVNKRSSYLFNGPQNTVNEGGPVPVLYGKLMIGSQVVGASYDIIYRDSEDEGSNITS